MSRILLIEDDPSGRAIAEANLAEAGFVVDAVATAREGLSTLDVQAHALVITDVRLPDSTGLEVVQQVQRLRADLPIVVITAYPTVDLAVSAMRVGAFDFISKPFGRERLLLTVRRALEFAALKAEAEALRVQANAMEHRMVFRSQEMETLVDVADRAAQSSAPVLITGEPGVGKGVLARRIHARSPRSREAFASVRCSVTPPDLLAREIFGPGQADDEVGRGDRREGKLGEVTAGTLFLDEFTALAVGDQRRLTQALDGVDRDSTARIIASTHLDPAQLAESDAVLDELVRRVGVVSLRVPPLRERREDIAPLAEFFVRTFARGRALVFEEGLMAALETRPWVGNVRELRNVCERLVVLASSNELRIADLPTLETSEASTTEPWPSLPAGGLSLIDLEKSVIERVLELKDGNVSQAASYLGVPRHFLAYRIQKYGIR